MEFDGAGGEGELETCAVAGLAHDEMGGGGVAHEFGAIAVGSAEGEADLLGAVPEFEKPAHRIAAGEFLFEGGADDPDRLSLS